MKWQVSSYTIKKLLDGEDVDVFENELEQNTENAENNIVTAFLELTNFQLNDIWRKLTTLCRTHAQNVMSDNNEVVAVGKRAIISVVQLAKLTLKEKPSYFSLDFQNAVVFLADWLQDPPNHADDIKNEILVLCEEWLLMDKEGKEFIAISTVAHLFQRMLQSNSPKSIFQRVWNIRNSIILALDVQTGTTEQTLELIKRCFFSKHVLTNKLGRKLMSFVFILDKVFMRTLHHVAKNFLMNCSLNDAEMYGLVYFCAWSSSKGILKETFEEACLQDLIFIAIHVPPTEYKLFSSIRKVLKVFSSKKFEEMVSSVILKLYDPIIWRSLKVANPLVRKNASILMFDAFPVEEPNSTLEAAQITMQSQCQAMKDLLEDSCHSVRAVAALQLCSVLRSHWEIFPPEIIPQILKFLCKDLMFDSSSVEVRTSVLKGLTMLLENQLSYPLLKVLLPNMSMAFHDVSEKVRFEFCKLLLKVKVVPDIQYWKLVPMDHLLARLEEDELNICKTIFNLISNSFFSQSYSDEERLYRCCELINMNRPASREFFYHLSKAGDSDLLTSYCVVLAGMLAKNCKRDIEQHEELSSSSDESSAAENKENEEFPTLSSSAEKDNSYLSNPDIVCGLLDSVCILWWGTNADHDRELQSHHLKAITDAFRTASPFLFKRFKKYKLVLQTLIYLCSCLKVPIANLGSKSLSLLKAFPDAAPSEQYINILGSSVHQNQSTDVLALIHSWLSFELTLPMKENKRPNSKRKRVVIVDPVSAKPLLAVHFLQDLLLLKDSRAVLLDKHYSALQDIILLFPSLKEYILAQCKPVIELHNSKVQTNTFLVDAFSVFCQLALLLNQEKQRSEEDEMTGKIPLITDTLYWFKNDLLPLWTDVCNIPIEDLDLKCTERKDLMQRIFESLIKVVSDMYLVGMLSDSLHGVLEDFLCSLLQSGMQDIDFLPLCGLLNNIVWCAMSLKANTSDSMETPRMDKLISKVISKFLSFVSKSVRISCNHGLRDITVLKPQLATVFSTMLKWRDPEDLLLHDLVATMMAASVAELKKLIDKHHTFEKCDEIIHLPPVSSAVLDILASKPTLLSIFLEEMEECLSSGVIKEISGSLAVAHILRTLVFDLGNDNILKQNNFRKVEVGLQKLCGQLKESSCQTNEDMNSDSSFSRFSEMLASALEDINKKLG